MEVEIKNEYPPNYDLIKMSLNPPDHSVFTINGVIYNPSGREIDPDILHHEKVHIRQQKNNQNWLTQYLTDTKFREQVEVEAYGEQYKYLKDELKANNKELKYFLYEMSCALSSDYKLGISYQEAENKIRNYDKYNGTGGS